MTLSCVGAGVLHKFGADFFLCFSWLSSSGETEFSHLIFALLYARAFVRIFCRFLCGFFAGFCAQISAQKFCRFFFDVLALQTHAQSSAGVPTACPGRGPYSISHMIAPRSKQSRRTCERPSWHVGAARPAFICSKIFQNRNIIQVMICSPTTNKYLDFSHLGHLLPSWE